MDDRDFDRAKAHLQAYVAARPDDGEGHFLLARACRRARVEDFEQAHRNLEEARRLGYSGAASPWNRRCWTSRKTAPPDAQAELRRLPGCPAGQWEVWCWRRWPAAASDRTGWTRPTAGLNAWVDMRPGRLVSALWRGALFEYMNLASLAVADFEFVRKKRPGDDAIRMRRGPDAGRAAASTANEALKYLEPYGRVHPEDADVAGRDRPLPADAGAAGRRRKRCSSRSSPPTRTTSTPCLRWPWSSRTAATTSTPWNCCGGWNRWSGSPMPQAVAGSGCGGWSRCRITWTSRTGCRSCSRLLATVLGRLGRTEEARHYLAEADQLEADTEELKKAVEEYHQTPHDVAVLEKRRRPLPAGRHAGGRGGRAGARATR